MPRFSEKNKKYKKWSDKKKWIILDLATNRKKSTTSNLCWKYWLKIVPRLKKNETLEKKRNVKLKRENIRLMSCGLCVIIKCKPKLKSRRSKPVPKEMNMRSSFNSKRMSGIKNARFKMQSKNFCIKTYTTWNSKLRRKKKTNSLNKETNKKKARNFGITYWLNRNI